MVPSAYLFHFQRMVSSVFYCSLLILRMVSSVLELIYLWTVSSLFDFICQRMVSSVLSLIDGRVVRFHYGVYLVCLWKGLWNPRLCTLQATDFILVSCCLLGCWLFSIGNSLQEIFVLTWEFIYSLSVPCFNLIFFRWHLFLCRDSFLI